MYLFGYICLLDAWKFSNIVTLCMISTQKSLQKCTKHYQTCYDDGISLVSGCIKLFLHKFKALLPEKLTNYAIV